MGQALACLILAVATVAAMAAATVAGVAIALALGTASGPRKPGRANAPGEKAMAALGMAAGAVSASATTPRKAAGERRGIG